MKKEQFDFESFKESAKKKLQSGKTDLFGKEGVFTPLLKDFLEECLEGELDAHLSKKEPGNRRNGKSSKKVKTSLGEVEISTPRDRDSSFQPEIIGKRKSTLGSGLERQILTLYSKGSSYEDIRTYLDDMYDLDVSTSTIGRITDRIIPLVQEWQNRPLESTYPIVWLDAVHFKVRQDGMIISKAVYSIIGVNQHGYKEVLGLYLGENEGAKFWLRVLSDLQERGVEDILIACIDNLKGFSQAIETVYSQASIQLCIVHQIRNAKKYLNWNDMKAFMKDLKKVYKASSIDEAENALNQLDKTWGRQYPHIIKSWRQNWDKLSVYFSYPPQIKRLIYTTNPVESFHRQLRKITKTKGSFSSDNALMNLLYLGQKDVVKKWSEKPVFGWNTINNQLKIIFDERMP